MTSAARRLALPRWLVTAAAVLLTLAGGATSYLYSRALWYLDPDATVPAALWRGIQAHGPAFAATWRGTPDNWLFNLLPLDAALISLAPGWPEVIVLSGWLIFAASAVLAGMLAAHAANRQAGFVTTAVLSLAGPFSLGAPGALSYPVTHNVTMLFGLVALALAAPWLRRGGIWRVAAAGLVLTLNALSDPWAVAAILLPVAIAAAGLGALGWRTAQGRRALVLAAIAGLALIVVRTEAFGLLAFVPDGGFAPTDRAGLSRNAQWLFRSLAAQYNVVPTASPETGPALLVSGAVAFLALAALGAGGLLRLRDDDVSRRFLIATALLSIGAVLAACLLGSWPPGFSIGRFLPNLYFLGAVAAAGALVHCRTVAVRIAAATWIGLVVIAGLSDRSEVWRTARPPARDARVDVLIEALRREGLTYGYGGYWDAHALPITWITDGAIVIRPVVFHDGRVAPRPVESSPFWYRQADEPPGLVERFVAIPNGVIDCPDPAACEAATIRHLGPPDRTATYPEGRILIWRRSLASAIGAP